MNEQHMNALIQNQTLSLVIPVLGLIAAGYAEEQNQENAGGLPVNLVDFGIKPTRRSFALKVQSDSMIGRHIAKGDVVVLEHGLPPRHGDVVAALIDNRQVLRTAVIHKGKLWLRAENPNYPRFILAEGLVIEGVMILLIRKDR